MELLNHGGGRQADHKAVSIEATPSVEKLLCADSSWERREDAFPPPWATYAVSYTSNSRESQLTLGKLYLFTTSPPLLSPFAHCFRKWDFAPRPSILHRPHEDVGLCQEAELGPARWNPWWAPCLCLRMWKKPGNGPRSASQNYITIIPLSVSEASWAPAQSGRKVGECWQRVDVWLETTDGV